MSPPEDRAKLPKPNTLHDQAAPNTLRSPSGLSGRPDARVGSGGRENTGTDDQAAVPAPPSSGRRPSREPDSAGFETSQPRALATDTAEGAETEAATEARSATPDMSRDGTITGEAAVRDLADLARKFEAVTRLAEAGLVRAFEHEAANLAAQTGRLELTETDDERLTIDSSGAITADVIPEGAGSAWRRLATPDELVEFYDPTDLFDDLADALGRAAPVETAQTPEEAAAQLQGLAARFRARTGAGPDQGAFGEARLLEEFEAAAQLPARRMGEILLVDGSDERITFESDGRFRAAVVPNDAEGSWKTLRTPDELVEYYTPAELLDHLAARLRSVFPDAGQEHVGVAVQLLAELARDFAERSRVREIELLNRFELSAADLTDLVGDVIVVDDEDERLVLGSNGHFSGSIVPKDRPGRWETLEWPDELIEFYDPADMFADLADALAEGYPSVAFETESSRASPT